MRQKQGKPFAGFAPTNMTQVPDEFFDVLAPQLGEAELRVLLYIFRRTFGFKKTSDDISLKQLVEGIRKRDGERLDYGAGVVKSAASRAVKGLLAKGIIVTQRNRSAAKGDEPTTYALRFRIDPVSSTRTGGSPATEHGGVLQQNPQETELQDTGIQHTASSKFSSSNGAPSTRPPRHAAPALPEYPTVLLTEFSAEFDDAGSIRSNVTRAARLLDQSGLSESTFVQRLFEARSITRDEINRRRSGGGTPVKRSMPFFFAVLQDLLRLKSGRPA